MDTCYIYPYTYSEVTQSATLSFSKELTALKQLSKCNPSSSVSFFSELFNLLQFEDEKEFPLLSQKKLVSYLTSAKTANFPLLLYKHIQNSNKNIRLNILEKISFFAKGSIINAWQHSEKISSIDFQVCLTLFSPA